jgi:integrase
MFGMAESWGMHHGNPVKGVKFLPENSFNPITLGKEQEARLIAAAPDYIRDLLAFDLNTGLRRSDLLGLKWESVDMERREIRLVVKKNQKLHELPLNDVAFGVLGRQKRVSEFVFINPLTKKPVKDVRVALAKTAERAGVPKLTWHMLRHTIATRLLEVTDMVTVQEVLGHQSINTTKRYTHPGKQRKRGAMDLLVKRPSNDDNAVPMPANDNISGVGHNLGTVPQWTAAGENVVQ